MKLIGILRDYLSLTKPRINALVLVTTFIGAWLASNGSVSYGFLLKLLAGTGLTVAGASAFNCSMEADVDARMERTADRPLPAGRISRTSAIFFASSCSIGGLILLLATVNATSAFLALAALVTYTPLYTWMKGFTSLSTLIGAIPGALPPVIGWASVTGDIELPAVLLFLIMFVWQPPHFLALALYRKREYDAAGLVMLPIESGDAAAVRQIVLYALVLLPLSLLPVHFGMAGSTYLPTATGLGVGFLLLSILGLRSSVRERTGWARSLFVFSILHLTGLFVGLFFSPAELS
jgi:protoheme IX farnesyltransferase